jgi:hypothetical protein
VQSVRFRLDLSRAQVLAYYRGAARQVIATAMDGRRVRFPAEQLRPFVAGDGVHGLFEMRFGEDHRLIDLRRIAG